MHPQTYAAGPGCVAVPPEIPHRAGLCPYETLGQKHASLNSLTQGTAMALQNLPPQPEFSHMPSDVIPQGLL